MYENQKMPQKAEAKIQTESERVLGTFDYKLERLDKLCSSITNKVTNAVGFEQRPTDEAQKEGLYQGSFINELDGRLANLQKLIDKLDDIDFNLSRLI
jgi:hypothetical protein